MTQLGVDFGALNWGASQLDQAAGSFGQAGGQIAGTPGAAAPGNASGLLDRVLAELGGALGRAGAELGEVAGHLSATAATYENTERALAGWLVPGGRP